MSRQFLGLLVATAVILSCLTPAAMAAKTDIVVLVNGNAVTGENIGDATTTTGGEFSGNSAWSVGLQLTYALN